MQAKWTAYILIRPITLAPATGNTTTITSTDADAYRHSKWLAFMERRLKLAKQLLNPNDSVLIVTIDEKEYLRLGLLLEQVFPEAHIQMVSIVINPNGVARDKEMYRLEEYAFYVYVGDAGPSMLEDPLFTSDINQRKEIADDAISRSKRGVRWERLMRGGSNSDRLHSPGCFYPVYIDPKKKRIVEVGDSLPIDQHPSSEFDKEGLFTAWPIARGTGAEKVWQMNPGNLRKLVVQGLAKVGAYDRKRNRYSILYLGKKQRERIERGEILIVGRDDNNIVELEESEEQQILKAPKTIWNRQAHNAGEYGSRLVRAMLPQRVFPYPKSLYAVEDALKTVTKDKRDALIVDFFSGSGTTAHAVMRLNHQDGGHRCSISITNNEVSEDETKKLIKRGLRQGDPDWEALGICQYVTKPRVTAAITGKTPRVTPSRATTSSPTSSPWPTASRKTPSSLTSPTKIQTPSSWAWPSRRSRLCSGCALVRVAASSSTSSRALPWPTPMPSFSTLLRLALS